MVSSRPVTSVHFYFHQCIRSQTNLEIANDSLVSLVREPADRLQLILTDLTPIRRIQIDMASKPLKQEQDGENSNNDKVTSSIHAMPEPQFEAILALFTRRDGKFDV